MVYFERSFRTIEAYADKDGNITHVTEFLDNKSGEYARTQYQARVGDFSSAQNYKKAGLGLIPIGFYGFDYVTQPNYTTNVGNDQLFDGLAIPVEQDGLIASRMMNDSEAMLVKYRKSQNADVTGSATSFIQLLNHRLIYGRLQLQTCVSLKVHNQLLTV
ncbi:hypothetical protein [Acinetobacter tjernbergiae]|uniref:hypothetical protein n=1 Tax=Acinetobacter tjernbergiae TaxID=202955 RepID=UPI0003A36F7C|nr:hypothetical protein [Acinetobacter tjernbergiae]